MGESLVTTKAEVGRIAKEYLEPLLSAAGFRRKGSTVYWRVRDNLLQFISLQVPPRRFTTEVTILPLFVPSDGLVHAFGDRLGRFVDGRDHWYQTEPVEALLQGLQASAEHLREYALPWFDRLDRVQLLTDWYGDRHVSSGVHGARMDPSQMAIWLGYCYAYLGDHSRAASLLGENLHKAIRPEWPDYAPTVSLLQALQTAPDSVPTMLAQFAATTYAALKLR
jgi:hypothetical protein